MKYVTLLLACLLSATAFSQNQTYTFEGNNFRWKQNTNGMLFFDMEGGQNQGLEVPIDGESHTVFSSTLNLLGMDSSEQLHGTHQMFCQEFEYNNCLEVWGPLKNGATSNEPGEFESYNQIWFVTRMQTELHQLYFDCIDDSNCDLESEFPAYEIPSDFLDWPAHGDTLSGFAEYLAPFMDRNGDNRYDASEGDAPLFCGDFSSYQITNDVGSADNPFLYDEMGVEIHTQVYGFNGIDGALFNTLFVKQKLINRSDNYYSQVYVGSSTDFDIGDPNDDAIGTDVQRSMYYAYNGDPFDGESSSGPGYGEDLAAMGVKYLSGPLKPADGVDNEQMYGLNTYANQGEGHGDGVIDNERNALWFFYVS